MTNRKSMRTVSQHEPRGPRADAALDAVGDRTRRLILERLRDGPLSVARLADVLPVTRPAVSQHLKVLKEAGLVVDRADGTRRLYELDPQGIEALQRYASELWSSALASFATAAADAQPATPGHGEP
ncbi:MAG TPA: metalloregulator ArsR/SmtB family transcription factor [Acidimicrobiales bacterium]